jgi:hypothetical protein
MPHWRHSCIATSTSERNHELRTMIRDLLSEAGAAGQVRDDVAPDELASFCLHALAAAGALPSEGCGLGCTRHADRPFVRSRLQVAPIDALST